MLILFLFHTLEPQPPDHYCHFRESEINLYNIPFGTTRWQPRGNASYIIQVCFLPHLPHGQRENIAQKLSAFLFVLRFNELFTTQVTAPPPAVG